MEWLLKIVFFGMSMLCLLSTGVGAYIAYEGIQASKVSSHGADMIALTMVPAGVVITLAGLCGLWLAASRLFG